MYYIYLVFHFSKPPEVLDPRKSFCTSWRAWALASVPRCLASVPQCLAWDALGTLLDALGTLLDALGTLLDAHGTLLDALGGVMLDKNHSTRAPKSDFSCPGLDFGRILVPPIMDFHAFIMLLRSTALTFSKKPQPMKNIGKT